MAVRLKKSIKAASHADALKKARRMLATSDPPYIVDKVEFTVKRGNVRYYRVWMKSRKCTKKPRPRARKVTQIMHKGALRSESSRIWTDDWNFDDEVAYRKKHRLSMSSDR